jgi:hypothetical protein
MESGVKHLYRPPGGRGREKMQHNEKKMRSKTEGSKWVENCVCVCFQPLVANVALLSAVCLAVINVSITYNLPYAMLLPRRWGEKQVAILI